MFSYTFWSAHWACTLNILQLRWTRATWWRTMPQTRWMWGYTPWFWSPCWTVFANRPLGAKSLQVTPFMRSTRQRERKTCCHFGIFWPLSSSNQIWLHKDIRGNYGLHSPCQQLGSWFHVTISNFPHQKTGVWSFTSSATCPIVLHSPALTMFLPLLQQGCDLRWETASAAPGLCPGSGGQMRPVFHVAALAWHRILERIQPTRRNMKKQWKN